MQPIQTVFCRFAIRIVVAHTMLGTAFVAAADVSHEMGKIKVSDLRETSGMVASRLNPNVLWVHNDGPVRQLYAVSTTGKLVAIVDCSVPIADLEDIAIGPGPKQGIDYLYLGDIGDNSARRREVRVVRFPEPELTGERGQRLNVQDAESLRLVYPDGPHDAETLIVDPKSGELLIVTKENGSARVYSVPAKSLDSSEGASLSSAGTLSVDGVSAGAISNDGSRLILRRENQGWLWERRPEESIAEALARKPQKIDVLGKRQGPNGESVSFTPSGGGYYTLSEGKKQAIYRFDLPARQGTPQP
jgi:hypothetical protein